MNADLIARESHLLLQEVASYEEPRLALPDAPTLAALAKSAEGQMRQITERPVRQAPQAAHKGQSISDNKGHNSRKAAILEILNDKGPSYIKDISVIVRDVSEKTIQRELQALVAEGRVVRSGERRWTTYSLKDSIATN